MKNRTFLGTLISEGFWKDFGRVLGGANPLFSQFFRCYFEAKFEFFDGMGLKEARWRSEVRKRGPKGVRRDLTWQQLPEPGPRGRVGKG